jgi:hypothetical protein
MKPRVAGVKLDSRPTRSRTSQYVAPIVLSWSPWRPSAQAAELGLAAPAAVPDVSPAFATVKAQKANAAPTDARANSVPPKADARAQAVLLFAHIAPATADGWPHHHGKHHAHVAYTDWCRVGWWQSLYYGHVRPQWEARCR